MRDAQFLSLLVEQRIRRFLRKHRKPQPLKNETFEKFQLFQVLSGVILALSTPEGRAKVTSIPNYLEFCETGKLEPIPFWEDAQFAQESKVVSRVVSV